MEDNAGATPRFPMKRDDPLHPPRICSELRADQPLSRVTIWDGSQAWLVTRYDDVRAVLSDSRFSADSRHPNFPTSSPVRRQVLNNNARSLSRIDPPEHDRLRRMLRGEFTVRRMEALRPQIQAAINDLLDEMLSHEPPVDLVEAVAMPLPSLVICHVLGVDYADRGLFEGLSRTIMSATASPSEVKAAMSDLYDYLDRLLMKKELVPGDDLISRLFITQVRPGHLTRDALIGMARMLLAAGHDTTANMISLSVLSLLLHPDQYAALRKDPTLVGGAVDELLRFHTIVQTGAARVAVEDVCLAGGVIRAGEGVFLALNSANRDERAFSDPDHLDIRRPASHHVAFGFGIHQCLGQLMARVELEVTLSAIMRRIPTLRLAAPIYQLPFRHDMAVYGLRALPVSW